MNLFKLFKRKPKCPYPHYKKGAFDAGYKKGVSYDHMKRILSIDLPHYKDRRFYDYKIYECEHCGKRAFGCLGIHSMNMAVTEAIDNFIEYKIELTDLLKVLQKYNYCWKIKGTIK